jgi:hypothetical protein
MKHTCEHTTLQWARAGFSSCGVIVGDITPDKWFFFSLPLANLIIVRFAWKGGHLIHYGA